MTPRLPIVIASKGRPQGKTMQALQAEGLPFTVYVEPQEAATYQAAGWTVRVLGADDQGLTYVRQQILADAAPDWFWMLDDDIDGWYQTVQRKNRPVSLAAALAGAEPYFMQAPMLAQAGLEYQQFAWRAKQPYVLGSYCDVCVAIHAGRTQFVHFRPACDVKVDRDFTLQVLAAGYETCRVTAYSFSCPKNGSNAGGLAAVYATAGREAAACRTMVALWPGICSYQIKSDGRHDVAIAWGAFRRMRQQGQAR